MAGGHPTFKNSIKDLKTQSEGRTNTSSSSNRLHHTETVTVNVVTFRPAKSYSHLHVGEGWKQTDTSFPIALYVGSVSLAKGEVDLE